MEATFAEIVRRRRRQLGFTQAQVAANLGFKSADYICLIEQGLRNIDLDKVPLLAEILQLDPIGLSKLALVQQYPVFARSLLLTKAIRTSPPRCAEVHSAADRLRDLPAEIRQIAINMINSLYDSSYRSKMHRVA